MIKISANNTCNDAVLPCFMFYGRGGFGSGWGTPNRKYKSAKESGSSDGFFFGGVGGGGILDSKLRSRQTRERLSWPTRHAPSLFFTLA